MVCLLAPLRNQRGYITCSVALGCSLGALIFRYLQLFLEKSYFFFWWTASEAFFGEGSLEKEVISVQVL
jgi:hypothetical protein